MRPAELATAGTARLVGTYACRLDTVVAAGAHRPALVPLCPPWAVYELLGSATSLAVPGTAESSSSLGAASRAAEVFTRLFPARRGRPTVTEP